MMGRKHKHWSMLAAEKHYRCHCCGWAASTSKQRRLRKRAISRRLRMGGKLEARDGLLADE